jgi:hypothetical protein
MATLKCDVQPTVYVGAIRITDIVTGDVDTGETPEMHHSFQVTRVS